MLREPVQNAEPARWLAERLTTFGENVLSVVPSGFEAYARVFHPASRVTLETESPVGWAEVAALTGRTAHRAMQWPSLRGENSVVEDETALEPGAVWVRGPEMGTLPLNLAQMVWPVLSRHTGSDECFFAVWEGFGCLPRTVPDAPAFELPGRRFHLFTGRLEAIEATFCTNDADEAVSMGTFVSYDPEEENLAEAQAELDIWVTSLKPLYQSANLWWPEDRAWCVATEIDFVSTYVAGSQRLIDAVLDCKVLEAFQVRPSDGITHDGDVVNPRPKDRDAFEFSFLLE